MSNMNFSSRVLGIFDEFKTDYEGMTQLMTDLALGREIYDAETGRVISKAEAEATVLDFNRKVLGITPEMVEKKDMKAIKRSIEDNKKQWFRVLEDTLDNTLEVGLSSNEWFNTLAEVMNIGYGDRQDFIADTKSYLAVAKVGTAHHDHIMQRIKAGERYTIPTERHAVKVGVDIHKYILGQSKFDLAMQKIDDAYTLDIQNEILKALDTAIAKVPATAEFVGTGDIVTKKNDFLKITDNVADANNVNSVVVMGTRPALRKVMDIIPTDWIAPSSKEERKDYGIIATAEGITLARIPNRYKDTTYSTGKIFDDDVLWIFAQDFNNKFIKVIERGGAEISEVRDNNEGTGYLNELMSYEVQRDYGAGIVPGYIFGKWTLA